jgi:hypothetical protein
MAAHDLIELPKLGDPDVPTTHRRCVELAGAIYWMEVTYDADGEAFMIGEIERHGQSVKVDALCLELNVDHDDVWAAIAALSNP